MPDGPVSSPYNNSIFIAIVVLYLVAWTKSLEEELSTDNDDDRSPWTVTMNYLVNILQSLLLLILGVLILKTMNMIHYTLILDTPDSRNRAQLGEVFDSVIMVLKQCAAVMLAPIMLSLGVVGILNWILKTFTAVQIAPVTTLVCNLIFTFVFLYFD